MNQNKLLLWFLVLLSALLFFQTSGKNGSLKTTLSENDLGLATAKTEYSAGKEIILTVQNNTRDTIELNLECEVEPFSVFFYKNEAWEEKTTATKNPGNCTPEIRPLEAGKISKISYRDYTYRLFTEPGRYRIDATIEKNGEPKTYSSNEFTIAPRGILGRLWLNGVYRPILNALIFLIQILPGHSLGFGIIALTILIRTLLLIPSQRAMRSQKKMQDIQEKIKELQKKHKDDKERLALETVQLWKQHKVNPFGSCFMMLIQLPILIALYYVVQQGLNPDKSLLLYKPLADVFSYSSIETNFLGILELTKINFWVLPILVGGLQFIQMHLAMSKAKKKREEDASTKKALQKAESTGDMQNEMQMATNMMKYMMPAMIAFFTASLPAGVGLYWGTSTLYGIAQQFVINKQSTSEKEKDEPVVRVIEKTRSEA